MTEAVREEIRLAVVKEKELTEAVCEAEWG